MEIPTTSLQFATACCLTPAAWPYGRMLLSTGNACPSAASWAALLQARIRPLRCGQGGRHGFWLLLPEQKWLGCRAEPRRRSYMLIMPVSRMWARTCRKIFGKTKKWNDTTHHVTSTHSYILFNHQPDRLYHKKGMRRLV
jgi:hypothetical protein